MYVATKIFSVLVFTGSLTTATLSSASDEISSAGTETRPMSPGEGGQERHVLGQLAVSLAGGSAAMRPLRAVPVRDDDEKDRLEPSIPGMDCSIDRILSYVSCYSSTIATKDEAQHRLRTLLDELEATLPANRWRAAEMERRINSIASYTFADQISDASIDLDIIEQPTREGGYTYAITIYGWAAPDLQITH